jgi:hypothetical protein
VKDGNYMYRLNICQRIAPINKENFTGEDVNCYQQSLIDPKEGYICGREKARILIKGKKRFDVSEDVSFKANTK